MEYLLDAGDFFVDEETLYLIFIGALFNRKRTEHLARCAALLKRRGDVS